MNERNSTYTNRYISTDYRRLYSRRNNSYICSYRPPGFHKSRFHHTAQSRMDQLFSRNGPLKRNAIIIHLIQKMPVYRHWRAEAIAVFDFFKVLLKEIREETLFGANFLDSASELCNVIPLGEVISDLQKNEKYWLSYRYVYRIG